MEIKAAKYFKNSLAAVKNHAKAHIVCIWKEVSALWARENNKKFKDEGKKEMAGFLEENPFS